MSNTLHYLIMDIQSIDLNFVIHSLEIITVVYMMYKIYKLLTFNEIVVDLSHIKWNQNESNLRRMYTLQELPPFYPNGWISVLESRVLKKNQIKPVFGFGNDLVVFRGGSGNVYVADAYCPHLGANLGVGGQVIGDSIRCPYHGWTFDRKGYCTGMPGIESSDVPKVGLKLWDSIEVNGFIFVWHHSEGEKPNWFPIKIDEIENSQLVYRGRTEHIVNCHLQEIPENGADVMHLNEIHSAPEFLGTVITRSKFFYIFMKFLTYNWTADWRPCPSPNQHIAKLDMTGNYSIFGYPFLPLRLSVKQIGPANVHHNIQFNFLGEVKCLNIQTIQPISEMKHKIIHHFYTEPTLKAFLFSKYIIYGEARMVERDIVIWNNKKFLKQPYFSKNEAPLVKFRRWFTQFYTEKCPATI